MGMQITVERKKIQRTFYMLEFNHKHGDGGFAFDCDKHGNLLPDVNDCAMQNYYNCVNDTTNFMPMGVIQYTHSWIENARGLCNCGTEIELRDEYHGACQCNSCGQCYNLMGQSLVPPEYWLEDTHDEYDD